MSIFKKINNSKGLALNSSKGFTLIELMVVVVIIAVLSALIIVQLAGARQRARDARRAADVSQIRTALEFYLDTYGTYPEPCPATGGGVRCTLADGTTVQVQWQPPIGAPAAAAPAAPNSIREFMTIAKLPLDPSTDTSYGYAWAFPPAGGTVPIKYQIWAEDERAATGGTGNKTLNSDSDINTVSGQTWGVTSAAANGGIVNGTLEGCTSPTATDCVYDIGIP